MNWVFVASFVLVVLLAAAMAVAATRRLVGVQDWKPVEAFIERSEVIALDRRTLQQLEEVSTGGTFQLDLTYRYEVAGHSYLSTKIMRGAPNLFRTEVDAQRAKRQYPAGGKVTAFYNPRDPANAALVSVRGISPVAYVALFCFVVALLTIIGVITLVHLGVLDVRAVIHRLREVR